jgi:hypothetical protein
LKEFGTVEEEKYVSALQCWGEEFAHRWRHDFILVEGQGVERRAIG